MAVEFIWIGKTKNAPLAALEEEYLGRIRRFVRCHVRLLRDVKGRGGHDESKILEGEGKAILRSLRPGSYVVLLDERGTMMTSLELAELISRRQTDGARTLSFIVGSHLGVSEAVRRRADHSLSLSKMTLPHELVRVILLEQVYRAFAIIHRLPYPK